MMSNSMRNYFRRLAEGYENDPLSHALYPLLEISGGIYGGVVGAMRLLYEKKILRCTRLPFPVISVGNLTWGGTGKTPFVEYLARRIGEQQRTALILTRGYSHDEVEQIKHHLPHAIVGVGKNRVHVAQGLAKQHKIDAAILDDGLQHWPLERDLEIITVNALNPFGNGKILPRGILRESISTLKKAAVVVISHSNLVEVKELTALKERIKKYAPDVLIVESYLEPLFFYRARKRARVSMDRLHHQRVTTFSGVGAPRSFQLLLSRFQIKPVRNFEFADHYSFSESDLREIKLVSELATADEIVTTEKDFFRCPQAITDILNPLVLATRLRIASGESLLNERITRLLGVAQS